MNLRYEPAGTGVGGGVRYKILKDDTIVVAFATWNYLRDSFVWEQAQIEPESAVHARCQKLGLSESAYSAALEKYAALKEAMYLSAADCAEIKGFAARIPSPIPVPATQSEEKGLDLRPSVLLPEPPRSSEIVDLQNRVAALEATFKVHLGACVASRERTSVFGGGFSKQ